jgi:tetratricopeptide (TPR) repeat protein
VRGVASVSQPELKPPVLVQLYEDYLVSQDAASFIEHLRSRYTVGTLERLVTSTDRRTRRAAVLALGMVADYASNAVLGQALTDIDRLVRCLAENAIRALWLRDGTAAQRRRLERVVELNSTQQYKQALRLAGELIERAPRLAEAWNQRAIARYCLAHYEDSIADCRRALELNPYHFGAAGGMGQCYVHLDNLSAALECYRHALALNPSLEGIRASVNYLQRALGQK